MAKRSSAKSAEHLSGVESLDRLQQAAAAFARRSEYIRFFAATESNTPLDRSGYLLLTHLARSGPSSMGDLAREFDVNPSTITRQVRALADRGQVNVQRAEHDPKVTLVEVTAQGRSDAQSVRAARILIFQDLLADWDAGDVRDLADLLHRFVGVLAADEGAPRRNAKNRRHRLLAPRNDS